MKKKSKMTKTLIAATFLLTIIAIVSTVNAYTPSRILAIAKGDDGDIAGATTTIIAIIDNSSVPSVAQIEFQTKLYDESGKKIYSMKGKLKDALVISDSFQYYCTVREVMWVNLWFIMGEGKLKTTDANIEIDFRDVGMITLPNTKGRYVPFSFWMLINPKGEYTLEDPNEVFIWPQGGWATVVLTIGGIPTVGVVTYLTKYMEI
ncbi:MAG: hypothetical protein ACFFFB_14875 [Candidatus Heimdallarchaeota archaeon]